MTDSVEAENGAEVDSLQTVYDLDEECTKDSIGGREETALVETELLHAHNALALGSLVGEPMLALTLQSVHHTGHVIQLLLLLLFQLLHHQVDFLFLFALLSVAL